MIEIPAGKIELRDDRTKQKWIVKIEPFLLARFPVTQDLYFEITKESPSTFKGKKHTVETVSWQEANLFCNALSVTSNFYPYYHLDEDTDDVTFDPPANGVRLPPQAEWEYACKAATQGARYGDLDQIAWYKDNSHRTANSMAQNMPN